MSSTLQGKVALVTGAGSGIGRAVALKYAAEGAKVVVSDINAKGGNDTVAAIKEAGGDAIFVHADTSLPADNQALVAATVAHYGALHIACNNAGVGAPPADIGEYDIASWDKVIGINLSGVFYGMRYQIAALLDAGGGAIVNMASILGQVATRQNSAYVAAKHGVVGLTKAAALEYATRGIRVNTVGPGYIDTPALRAMSDAARAPLVAQHPIGRLGEPHEVAELVAWLSSDQASFVTAAYYAVDGGLLAQ
ncbi:glucose 1-dehydrogenase [Pseudoduganella sp. FT26W]|uniref:Glucose 1-dehydrogenase n=1 Tax=Duganella aquatilis TaxID=2666082 RepID=A0A844D3A0_9BURK|nr:glucose 1-dehydrogenase [Duganella aquatilis]MRW87313.1 glucose 1-dehydrogenase [Duganella aquatilis]